MLCPSVTAAEQLLTSWDLCRVLAGEAAAGRLESRFYGRKEGVAMRSSCSRRSEGLQQDEAKEPQCKTCATDTVGGKDVCLSVMEKPAAATGTIIAPFFFIFFKEPR